MNKILLIEDDIALNENLGLILQKNDFSLMLAENGKTGLQLAQSNSPDAIVCDIMLPDINGFEVIKSIKKIAGKRDIPFLFMSAKSEASAISRGKELGADDYLVKPFRSILLINSLRSIFEKRTTIKGNVLVLHKDARFASALVSLLGKNNYKCRASSTGMSAIELAGSNKCELILCGMQLDDMDGYSVIKKIKENPNSRNIPIVFLSPELNAASFRRVMDMGADDYLISPFNFDEILQVVDLRISRSNIASIDRLPDINNLQPAFNMSSNTFDNEIRSESTISLPNQQSQLNKNNAFTISPAWQADLGRDAGYHVMNRLLFNKNISKDYDTCIYRGISIVLVNLVRGNLKEAQAFQKYLGEIIQSSYTKILIDLSNTEYMDSVFVGVLIDASRKLKFNCEGELRMVMNLKVSTTNPLFIERLKKNFNIYDNINIAINCFESGGMPDRINC